MSRQAIFVKTTTQPGKRDEVRSTYERMMAPRAEANEAQEVVVWLDDHEDPDTFYLFEIYSSSEAMQQNSQAPWFFEYLGAVGPLLAGEPQVTTASPAWAKGV